MDNPQMLPYYYSKITWKSKFCLSYMVNRLFHVVTKSVLELLNRLHYFQAGNSRRDINETRNVTSFPVSNLQCCAKSKSHLMLHSTASFNIKLHVQQASDSSIYFLTDLNWTNSLRSACIREQMLNDIILLYKQIML